MQCFFLKTGAGKRVLTGVSFADKNFRVVKQKKTGLDFSSCFGRVCRLWLYASFNEYDL